MDLCVPTSGSGQMKCVVILTENPQNVHLTPFRHLTLCPSPCKGEWKNSAPLQ